MKFKDAVQIFIGTIVIIAILGAMFEFSVNGLINFLIPFGVSFILSAFVGNVIEGFSGDFFNKMYLSFPVWKFRVNVPVMFILIFIIKIWWFG